MADYAVIKEFKCKLSKKSYLPGDTYTTNDTERAQLLTRKRRLAAEPIQKQVEVKSYKSASPAEAKRPKFKGPAEQALEETVEGD